MNLDTLLENGITFEQFALVSAAKFIGEPTDAPLPDKFVPFDHSKDLAKHKRKLARLKGMTKKQRLAFGNKLKVDAMKRRETALASAREMTERINALIAQLEAWEPPAGCKEMKEMMLVDLQLSLPNMAWKEQLLEEAKQTTAAELFALELIEADRLVTVKTGLIEKEKRQAQRRTAWVKALRESLEAAKRKAMEKFVIEVLGGGGRND